MRRAVAIAWVLSLLVAMAVSGSNTEPGSVVINEIAWSGSREDSTAEWIELFNPTEEAIDLAGWRLVSSDGAPDIALHGTIEPMDREKPGSGYLLLERGIDDAVPGVAAAIVYVGALSDLGESLFLFDESGALVDSANHDPSAEEGDERGWPAGTGERGSPPHASMERIDHRLPDDAENWRTWRDHESIEPPVAGIHGTPGQQNIAYNEPPVASMRVTPPMPRPGEPALFDATDSDDPNDAVASILWNFGDGTGAEGQTASHTYADAGTYNVVLSVADAKGGIDRFTREIRVMPSTPPVADFSIVQTGERRPPSTGDALRFQDESSDADGDIVSWAWAFGDGASEVGTPAFHAYDKPGEYVVRLDIIDAQGDGATQTQSVKIAGRPPIASFTFTPERPDLGEPVRFDASASHDPDGRIIAYRWDFDADGEIDLETADAVVDHTFAEPGRHDIVLSVVDDTGLIAHTSPHAERGIPPGIPVNRLPSAQFQMSTFEPAELEAVGFTDCSFDDAPLAAWSWDFGDGTVSDEKNPTHAYQSDGTVTVTLTVTDANGARATATAEVSVSNLPPTVVVTVDHPTRPTGDAFRFDASGSSDSSPDGSIATYEWDLDGDGVFSEPTTDATASRSYIDDGAVSVRVRVTDDDGTTTVSEPLTVQVHNRPPRIDAISWTPTDPVDGEPVTFSVRAHDPDGQIVRWDWRLGEETTLHGEQSVHTFPEDGEVEISLVVVDDDGAPSPPRTVSISIRNAPPVAEFTASSIGECTVRFNASGSYDPSPEGEIVHIAWDFGDGSSCPGAPPSCGDGDRITPTHCYSEPGTYIVGLVVVDDQGAISHAESTIHIAE